MEAPHVIKMLGSEVTIEFLDAVVVDNEPAMGSYDQELSRIVIKRGMSLSSIRDTLMHEIIHAILQHYEMDSEKTVRILTPALLSMLRDNPRLVSFLTEETGYPSSPDPELLDQLGYQS